MVHTIQTFDSRLCDTPRIGSVRIVQRLHGSIMARLHETIETPCPIERAFAFVADFSNSESLGSRHGHRLRPSTIRHGRARRDVPARRPHAAAASRRWSTGSRLGARARVVLRGRRLGHRRGRRHQLRAPRQGHPHRIHRGHPTPRLDARSCRRSPAGHSTRSAKDARDGMQRALDGGWQRSTT